MAADLGLVVVTYNSEDVIGPCLEAALGAAADAGLAAELVVVDNASTDGTRERVPARPGVRLIANPLNRGFAAAVNQGVAVLEAPAILLLNPDARVARGLAEMRDACLAQGAGAAGGRLLDARSRPQTGFMVRRFPTSAALVFEVLGWNRLWSGNPVNRRYRCLDFDPLEAADVEQPAGAFLMFRREAWSAVGGFDEAFYPIWFEDVDFCLRVRRAGYRIRYVPAAVASHAGAHSLRDISWGTRQAWWYDSLLRYTVKHFAAIPRSMVAVSVMLGVVPRALAALGSHPARDVVSVCGEVFRLAYRRGLCGVRPQASGSSFESAEVAKSRVTRISRT